MGRKVGRPKGSGGPQPNWKFTPARQKNLTKARRINAVARKKLGIGRVTTSNRDAYKRAVADLTNK